MQVLSYILLFLLWFNMVQYDFNKGYMGERLKFAVTLFKKKTMQEILQM